jgi:signal transduction histidine kinase
VETIPSESLHPYTDDNARARTYISRMTDSAAESLEQLPAMRRAHRVGPAVVAVVVVISFLQEPAPALTGRGLGVSLSLLALIAATVVLVRRSGAWTTLAALGAMIVAAAGLVWLQPTGAGAAGLFVAAAVAGLNLAQRRSLAVLALDVAVLILASAHSHRSGVEIAGTELGIVAFYLIARFGRAAAEAHEQARRLLLELQASRNAEAEAAMLRERSRLARDMHDVLAHSLSGLMLQLEGARMLSTRPDADGQLSPALDRAHHLARAGLEEARRAIAALRDEDLPGPDRLEQLAADHEQDSNIPTSLTISGAPRRLESQTALTLYRVAQEALTNVRKHAIPGRVELHLSYESDGTRLTVSDHDSQPPSRAPTPAVAGGGYGLTGMRERAELLGGQLDANRTTDGFRVELWIPA